MTRDRIPPPLSSVAFESSVSSADPFAAFEPTSAMREEAARWLIRLREPGRANLSEAFEAWKAVDPAHEFAFYEAEAFFDAAAGPAEAEAERARRAEGRRRLPSRVHSACTRSAPWLQAAAGLAAAVLIGLSQGDRIAVIGAEASTGAGQTRALTLQDGTRISLNTRSAVDDLTTPGRRGARLRRGEAFFEVARDPDRPFVVEAGDARIRVLGTRFNVRLDGDTARVTVEEGHVLTSGTGAPDQAISLTAGQEAVITADAARRQPGEAFEVAAWREGAIVLFDVPLASVVEELNRYRRAPIVVSDPALGRRTVSGVFDARDTDRAVRALEDSLGARAVKMPGGLTILY